MPIPTTSREMPDEKAAETSPKAKISRKNPSPIAAVAYQVAGLSGERMKARTAPRSRPLT